MQDLNLPLHANASTRIEVPCHINYIHITQRRRREIANAALFWWPLFGRLKPYLTDLGTFRGFQGPSDCRADPVLTETS